MPVNAGFVGEEPPFVDGIADPDRVWGAAVSEESKKGFLESCRSIFMLRLGLGGDGKVVETGDAARFRKGLFEEKLSVRLGDGLPSKVEIKESQHSLDNMADSDRGMGWCSHGKCPMEDNVSRGVLVKSKRLKRL